MSKNYDNWEKLVGAVLKREQLRQIALSHSRDSSSISDESSSFSFNSVSPSIENSLPLFSWDEFLPSDQRGRVSSLFPGKSLFLPVEARELMISTEDFEERLPYSTCFGRSTDTVEVNGVLSLDIRGTIKTRLLTPKTIYGAYLVFKLGGKFTGFKSTKAMISSANYETEHIVHLQPVGERKGEMAVRRADGWMEVQIGDFYVDEGEDQEVEARLVEKSNVLKMGLIIEGIEFRPLVSVIQV